MAKHELTIKTYLIVWAALLGLLVLTVAASYLHLGAWSVAIALTIAAVKAVLIMLYFMHIRYSSRLTWIFASAAILWLGILVTLSLGDYISRGWIGR